MHSSYYSKLVSYIVEEAFLEQIRTVLYISHISHVLMAIDYSSEHNVCLCHSQSNSQQSFSDDSYCRNVVTDKFRRRLTIKSIFASRHGTKIIFCALGTHSYEYVFAFIIN